MAGFVLMSFGLVAFAFVSGGILLIVLFLLLFTIGFGGTNTMRAIIPRAYFGLSGYGTYIGLITGVGTIGSMIGPLLAGVVFDTWGTYVPIWFVSAGIALVCCLLVALLPSVKPGETIASDTEVRPDLTAAGKE